MHEQSETKQNKAGKWINVYGRKTPVAGRRLPDTPEYDTIEEAVAAAIQRSKDMDIGTEGEGSLRQQSDYDRHLKLKPPYRD